MTNIRIRQRDRDAIINALRAGVVPRSGLQHIQVGRASETASLIKDVDRVADGGSAFRLILGEYGAGKTFFLNSVRVIAQEKKLVTAHADLNPTRRLHASGGQARSLFTELMKSLSTRAKPDGGALPGIIEKFVTSATEQAETENESVHLVIRRRLRSLEELVGGYDFSTVITKYWSAYSEQDDELMRHCEQWLRGEFSTRTDSRQVLGVRTIINDSNYYDQLKLFARFVRLAGYAGLLVSIDELVNLYKLNNATVRLGNYEQILRILNDSLQGTGEGLGFLLGGTPEFLMDPRRGLYSYPALTSRLSENVFAAAGFSDSSGTVLRLKNLTATEMYVLLQKLNIVFVCGADQQPVLPDEAIDSFMAHCQKTVGESYFRTPRLTIKSFLDLLAILEENPSADWTDLIEKSVVQKDSPIEMDLSDDDDELTAIRL